MSKISSKKGKKSSPNAEAPSKLLLLAVNQVANPLAQMDEFDIEKKAVILNTGKQELIVRHHKWDDLSSTLQSWMIELTETNMKSHYEQSAWGWNRQSKIGEFKHKNARHLLLYSSNNFEQPIGFVHFRFETGYASDATLYCYELQIVEQYRRQGVGKCVMNFLLQLAQRYKMKKVLITVLRHNQDAFQFYHQGLHFQIDPSSPSRCDTDADYEIMFRKP